MISIFNIKHYFLLLALLKNIFSEHSVCIRDYQKVGCFLQSKIYLYDILINDRVETKNPIDWQNYDSYLHSLLCRCNQKAIEKNKLEKKEYNFISIRFYGECYAGKEILNGTQVSGCKTGKYKECVDRDIEECAGTSLVEYLYRIKTSVDGGYSEWSPFSSCSKSCDGGIQVRTRTCTNPSPMGNGKDCKDLGQSIEERQCNRVSCSSECIFKYNNDESNNEIFVGKVKDENECIKKCFENQKSDPAINGIKMDLDGTICYCKQGMKSISEESNQPLWKTCFIPLKHRNGFYSTWSSFSTCSKSCDGGIEVRTRTCTNPAPLGDGRDCSDQGLDREERKCNTESCLGCTFKINDGVGAGEVHLGAVKNEAECVAKCFERQKIDPTINGVTTDLPGKNCYCEQGMTSQTGGSSWKSCYIPLRYRNGGYTEWSPFSSCSQSCDGGVEIRTRTCTNPSPVGDGKDCQSIGPSREERKCNEVFCDSGCVFKVNDGVGAGEVFMGVVRNENECIAKCYERQKIDPTINGVTTDLTGKSCYCEQGMKSQTGGSSWKSCFIPIKYRNGGYTEWSPFSTCSQSCDGGVEVRTRTCTNPTPVGDGKDCQSIGPSREERKCNEVFCDSGCVFKINDGVGAGEINMGAVKNENECIAKCFERQKIDPTINGVTTDLAGKSCYCEQGMKSQTGSPAWKSCFIKRIS
ncbi:coadhesin isoform X2 [Hydra vulgaris]|uniref:coadhesin isoform X2 n=1 Tax=Hydra vulgaris TaxID=6087 RepID=UPI001F5FA5B9|nr:coadhesin isoform X2 [Hydra vulgaris]